MNTTENKSKDTNLKKVRYQPIKIFLENEITDESFVNIFSYIEECKADKKFSKHLYLYINSPGGVICDGRAIYDYLMQIKTEGYEISTIITTQAASMAVAIYMTGDKRYMFDSSELMQHYPNISGGCFDSTELESEVQIMNQLKFWMLKVMTVPKEVTYTVEKLNDKISTSLNREIYLNKMECLESGFCNEQGLPPPAKGEIHSIYCEDLPTVGFKKNTQRRSKRVWVS